MNAINWKFLDEPAWRWFIFLGMIIAFMIAWNGVIDVLKGK